jgi:hypothetical protein
MILLIWHYSQGVGGDSPGEGRIHHNYLSKIFGVNHLSGLIM